MSEKFSPYYRNDLWSLDDGFGLGGAGDQVARMVLEVDPPFTLGVTGKWGAGKTSVMRRAFATLGGKPIQQALPFGEPSREQDGDDWKRWVFDNRDRQPSLAAWPDATAEVAAQTLCIWYSPWQHQNEDNPLVALIHEIRSQFDAWLSIKEAGSTFNRQAGLAAAKLLEHVADAAISLAAQRPVKFVRGITDAVHGAYKEGDERLTALSDGQRFHLLFEDAVQQVLKVRQRDADDPALLSTARLVVFVDDLDRCDGEVVVRLLEIIKLYLGTRRCVFVLGLDDSAVLAALKAHRSESDEGNREYLEKLFQARLSVPLPAPRGVRVGIEDQLWKHRIPRGPSEADVGARDEVRAATGQLAEDIERLLEPNPRKIKNFVNSLCAAWAMHGCAAWVGTDREYAFEARRFVLLQYLRHYHSPVWRLLERQPRALSVLWAVLTGAEGTEPIGEGDRELFEEKGLLREIFFRAFSHILCSPDPESKDRHGNEPLDEAVRQANERSDRKRSDDNFRDLFQKLFDSNAEIDPRHIYLTADESLADAPWQRRDEPK